MFSYLANGELDELLLVDYQICKWGSPAEDLLFFLTISPATDIRIKEFDNFVAIYHKRLIECLTILGYKKALPTLRELHMDMFNMKNSFYGMFMIVICMALEFSQICYLFYCSFLRLF